MDRIYFNELAESWDSTCKHDLHKVVNIISHLGVNPEDRVLDVGTGTGILVPYLADNLSPRGRIVAIDVAEKMLEVAARKFSQANVTYVHGDVLETSFDIDFNVIVCYSMYPHFKARKFEALQILVDKLCNGGKLCIAHSQSREAINALHLKAGGPVKEDRLPDMATMVGHFEQCGLVVDKTMDDSDYFVIIGKKPLTSG